MNVHDDTLRIVEAGMLAGIRPSLSLALCSLLIGFDVVPAEGALAMLGHPIGMTVACGIALAEMFWERDGDASVEQVLRVVRLVLAGAASLAAVATMAGYTRQEFGSVEIASGGGVAMMMGIVRTSVRTRAREVVHDVAHGWIARVEEGGLVALGTLMVFFPLLPLLILLLLSLGATAAFALAFVADRSLRRPCGACGHPARVEAVRCPKCQGRLEPDRWRKPPARLAKRIEDALAAPPAEVVPEVLEETP